MKKFLVLYHDRWDPQPETMNAWQAWFEKVGEHIVDSGNPLSAGIEVTHGGSRSLSETDAAATGYSIVSAASLEDAAALLDGCPFASSVRLYEAAAM
jgi:hypothetical protein